jgi:integrase/recombinase XerC
MAPFFLTKFLEYLKIEKRFSDHTVIAYELDLKQFIIYFNCHSNLSLNEITSFLIRGWIVELIDSSITARSVNRKLSSLRAYFNWLKKEGLIVKNPTLSVKGPKSEKRLPSFARESEIIKEKMDEVFSDSFEGIRAKLIIEILYQTGIRLSELINLKKSDIQTDRIKVLGKRNKERIIPISNQLYFQIEVYIENCDKIKTQSIFLLSLKNGEKVYPKFVYRIINTYLGHVTNLDKCSPHVLRHTFATHMLNNGAGLETLKDLLGHANLSATQVYTHNSFTQLNNIYSQAHPRGHKKK